MKACYIKFAALWTVSIYDWAHVMPPLQWAQARLVVG